MQLHVKVATLAILLRTLAACSSDSSVICPTSANALTVAVTVNAPDGTPICDAFITDSSTPNRAWCTWQDCVCHYASSMFRASPREPQPVTVIASRGGFVPQVVNASLASPDACGEGARPLHITLQPSTDPTGTCVQRDTLQCADHEVCYGATPATSGCMATPESSPDPGASYFCCTH